MTGSAGSYITWSVSRFDRWHGSGGSFRAMLKQSLLALDQLIGPAGSPARPIVFIFISSVFVVLLSDRSLVRGVLLFESFFSVFTFLSGCFLHR